MGIPVLKEISQSDIQCLFFSISFETSDSIIRDEAHILSSVKSAGYEFFFLLQFSGSTWCRMGKHEVAR